MEGRAFLVAGGGSGLDAARMLSEAGADVVVADLKRDEPVPAARFVEADVTSEDDVQTAVEEASGRGGLYGVVNCAGVAPPEKVVGRKGPHALDSFERVVRVNLVGSFNVVRLAAAVVQENEPAASGERGVIVNTASLPPSVSAS